MTLYSYCFIQLWPYIARRSTRATERTRARASGAPWAPSWGSAWASAWGPASGRTSGRSAGLFLENSIFGRRALDGIGGRRRKGLGQARLWVPSGRHASSAFIVGKLRDVAKNRPKDVGKMLPETHSVVGGCRRRDRRGERRGNARGQVGGRERPPERGSVPLLFLLAGRADGEVKEDCGGLRMGAVENGHNYIGHNYIGHNCVGP